MREAYKNGLLYWKKIFGVTCRIEKTKNIETGETIYDRTGIFLLFFFPHFLCDKVKYVQRQETKIRKKVQFCESLIGRKKSKKC